MNAPTPRPCGTWRSPITSELITAGTVGLGQPAVDGDDVYWLEARPEEGGRQVLVRRAADGTTGDVVPAPHNVRTRVHEYGGAAYAVRDGVVWFSDFATARLHRVERGAHPQPITPEGDLRYADLVVDAAHARLLCVLEDHTGADREARNVIAGVPWEGGAPVELCGGHDFVAAPRLSPDGRRLSWLTWDHPRMPWDGTDLWVAELDAEGRPGEVVHVAGGERESVLEPVWHPDGTLWFSSDRSGWWNLHRWDGSAAQPVAPMEAETAVPAWVLGMQHHAPLGDGRTAVVGISGAEDRLVVIDGSVATTVPLVEATSFGERLCVRDGRVVTTMASPTSADALCEIDITTGDVEVLRRSSTLSVDPAWTSVAEHIEFPTRDGVPGHAYLYMPRNPESVPAEGELPPCRVICHGGPTASTSTALRWSVQYFTSRGFAVLDVDYGGSTGYGRAYRERLRGRWGIVDLDDCVDAVRHLVDGGLVDGTRLCIEGGSAGGYTTLRALTATQVFAAGCSLFGVGDVAALARDTHKFESRYMDSLVGPYPERADLYAERSPLEHAAELRSPIILFQGLEDRVVPPAQSEAFFQAALRNGVPCCYEEFAGEQHGFRIAANIRRCLDAELAFYGAVLGFQPAQPLDPPLRIHNLSASPATS